MVAHQYNYSNFAYHVKTSGLPILHSLNSQSTYAERPRETSFAQLEVYANCIITHSDLVRTERCGGLIVQIWFARAKHYLRILIWGSYLSIRASHITSFT